MNAINFEKIISIENLLLAWKEFLRGKRNRKDTQEFQLHLMDNLLSLHNNLKNKTYTHGGYFSFNISDPKPRNIHKAIVRDRLLHHAIYRILYPVFDNKFIHDSYSCRIGKGTHKAMNRFRDFFRKVSKNNTKTCFVLKCDIRKFFANIDHAILKQVLEKHIKDKEIIWLLSQVIDSFHTQPNTKNSAIAESLVKGLPLGNLTSQLLVNIYMNEFDQFMKRKLKVKYYARYADDFVILSEDKNYLENLLQKISEFLEKELKLQLHPNKVSIETVASGIDFLGWIHFPRHRVLRTSTKRRMLKNIANNPKLETVQSYFGMLKHGNTFKLSKTIKS
ncbi:MAG: reverse transcriptase/maturase family protein [Candidatus Nomurabacteria bacterium]|nr:reverse transcriptase/maturase family protein [Candidatus Nomurabacteria bacterium]